MGLQRLARSRVRTRTSSSSSTARAPTSPTIVIDVTLEQFVATLPTGDGEVARLTYLEGLEPAEIAERLDKEPNAVYQAIHRNKKKLREWLEE